MQPYGQSQSFWRSGGGIALIVILGIVGLVLVCTLGFCGLGLIGTATTHTSPTP